VRSSVGLRSDLGRTPEASRMDVDDQDAILDLRSSIDAGTCPSPRW